MRLALAAIAICWAGAAQAWVCELLGTMDAALSEPATLARLDVPAGESGCTRSMGLGGRDVLTCGWPHPYRSDEARGMFDGMTALAEACLGPPLPPEPGVNHPDSHVLRVFERGSGVVAVSLKDKAARGESVVFLRLEVRRPEP